MVEDREEALRRAWKAKVMMGTEAVITIPYSNDNYSYLLVPEGVDRAVLVDCGDGGPVVRELTRLGLSLDKVLLTHHHYDHTDGVEEVLASFPEAAVYAPEGEGRIRGATNRVGDGERIRSGPLEITALRVPFHTLNCTNYLAGRHLFTSDTLFSAGCGRIFEGTAEGLLAAMDRIRGLPPETRIYFGHEYTEANLRFAAMVEPDNAKIRAYLDECGGRGKKGAPTTPTTLERELLVNPFLRIDEEAVIRYVDPEEKMSRTGRMAALRAAKDRF